MTGDDTVRLSVFTWLDSTLIATHPAQYYNEGVQSGWVFSQCRYRQNPHRCPVFDN